MQQHHSVWLCCFNLVFAGYKLDVDKKIIIKKDSFFNESQNNDHLDLSNL